MQTVVIYDVPDDKVRNKIADVCLDYALKRIQYSAFIGNMTSNRCEEMMKKIKRHLGTKEGNVQVFPICDKCLRQRKEVVNKPKTASTQPSSGSKV